MHQSGRVDQQASFSPATKKRSAGKQAARGWVLLLLFLPTKKSRRQKGRWEAFGIQPQPVFRKR